MKFAHIADVHLGKKIFPGTPKEKMASQAIYDGFAAFVDNMMIEQPDFIFITGDLFDHVPDKQDLFFVEILEVFKRINDSHVMLAELVDPFLVLREFDSFFCLVGILLRDD